MSRLNDPNVVDQWYLKDFLKAEKLYKTKNEEFVIAVIDDGVDIHHPDLKGKIWTNPNEAPGEDRDGNGKVGDMHGWNFNANNADVGSSYKGNRGDPKFQHGTFVAGAIAAVRNNAIYVAGAASGINIKIMSLKIRDDVNFKYLSKMEAVIDYILEKKVKMSVMPISSELPNTSQFYKIFSKLKGKNHLMFVSSPNNAYSKITKSYPCLASETIPNIICIAGIPQYKDFADLKFWDTRERTTQFMNRVPIFFSAFNKDEIPFTAAGDFILGLRPKKGNGRAFGSSAAVPIAASIAALAWDASPKRTALQMRACLTSGARHHRELQCRVKYGHLEPISVMEACLKPPEEDGKLDDYLLPCNPFRTWTIVIWSIFSVIALIGIIVSGVLFCRKRKAAEKKMIDQVLGEMEIAAGVKRKSKSRKK